ncbi:uncharacterized protein N7496_009530 [Penicillium cataractarum]|uniref:Uncharacterized protein n=1 Tax=Penicillium cataractarum TaxID=2100454 RepID=A0A9W9RP88_9EURO|nr:uncharacterized protein N7496_009530 [Penicillium cataractarum]KAJ5363817.1 hypothetical protein N7496_009530 [Penicillium cataractarum]
MPKPQVAEALRPKVRPTGRTRQPELSRLSRLHMFTSELDSPLPFAPTCIAIALLVSLAPTESPAISEHPAGPDTPHSLTRLQQ